MFCSNCGNEVTEGQRFCANCGHPLTDAADPQPTVAVEAEPANVDEAPALAGQAESAHVYEWVADPEPEPQPQAKLDPIEIRPVLPVDDAPSEARAANDPSADLTTAIPQPVEATTAIPQPVEPTAAIPQPVEQNAPYAAAPSSASVVPQVAGATAAGKRGMPLALKVGLAALGLFLVVRGVIFAGSLLVPRSSSEAAYQESVDNTVQAPSGIALDDDAASALFNMRGYPTLGTFMELAGDEVADRAFDLGYSFYDDGDSMVFFKDDGTIVFNAITTSGTVDEQGFRGLQPGGVGEPVVYVMVLEGYSTVADVLDGMANCTISGRKVIDEYELVALVTDSSSREYVVDVYDVGGGDYEVDLYNAEAIEDGIFDAVNEGTYGVTPRDVFTNFSA